MRSFILIAIVLLYSCNPSSPTDSPIEDSIYDGPEFKENIRTTEALTPEQERLGFKLPEGFEINLFAAEPDIGKPMNISFDASGRMWITQSSEYPFRAKEGEGKDKIMILEDTDNDGVADKFTTFADTLNIPIGILPVKDGIVAYSIPYVYKYLDTNRDGRMDGQVKLLGPFKTQDTHGMINNFVRGFDGWIHACHGFTNRDTVAGKDGHAISMISGNTFRFRPDGGRVEHITNGRINPFGLVYDEKGYLYSTDCHTSPLYQLIRSADYSQWGKEEEMGFGPDMTPLTNEATALAGIAYYSDEFFPKSFKNNFFVGDVVRSRVFRYAASFDQSNPVGKREEDFVLSKDPWFRPVDVKMGPDGAIYIADFYNPIIGHYEVPLDHPKRDHFKGRIWRITYKGRHHPNQNLMQSGLEELVKTLDHNNMLRRMMAMDELSDRIGKDAAPVLEARLQDKKTSSREYIHSLWVLQRLGALTPENIQTAAGHKDADIRLHTMRILAERTPDREKYFPLVQAGIRDSDPHVRRAATELLSYYPDMESLRMALALRAQVPEKETHFFYTTRMVIRNLLRNESLMQEAAAAQWNENESDYIGDVLLSVHSETAGNFLLNHLQHSTPSFQRAEGIYRHIARYVSPANLEECIHTAIEKKYPDTMNMLIYQGLQLGITQRGLDRNKELDQWGKSLAEKILTQKPFNKDAGSQVLKMQKTAADIAGFQQIKPVIEPLKNIVKGVRTEDLSIQGQSGLNGDIVNVKIAALKAIIMLDPTEGGKQVLAIIESNETNPDFQRQIGRLLTGFPDFVAEKIVKNLKNPSPDLQSGIAYTLSGTSKGKDLLFTEVKNNRIYPGILVQPVVNERILLNINPDQKRILEELTKDVSSIDVERQKEIESRFEKYQKSLSSGTLSAASGKTVFLQNCAACHRITEEGGEIGPNLDGVSQWSAKTLTEKIIEPNRFVSENFRNYTITLKDKRVISGLYRREEGAVTVFADVTGKEFSIPNKEIVQKTPSRLTLMPDDFRQRLNEKDFGDLVYFLLNPKLANQKK